MSNTQILIKTIDKNLSSTKSDKKKSIIQWDSNIIDNEFLQKKKKNCCQSMIKNGKVVGLCCKHKNHK